MPGSAHILRANALRIPLAAGSVHLALSSPPYFGLRDYRSGDESLPGQIGSEATPEEFLRALWAVSDEVWRVLTDDGSWFVNLGEKYAGTGGGNGQSGLLGISDKSTLSGNGHTGGVGKAGSNKIKATPRATDQRTHPRNNTKQTSTGWARPKSLMCLPWAFALGMIHPELYRDHIDPRRCDAGHTAADHRAHGRTPECGPPIKPHPRWILRAEVVWEKVNGLPESVDDRVRRAHETILHFTKQEHYFAAVDEIREPHLFPNKSRATPGRHHTNDAGAPREHGGRPDNQEHPLGKLPGSVWRIASEPLKLPTWKVVRAGRTVQWFTGKEDDAYALALKWMRAMGTSGGRPSLRRVTSHFAAFPTELPRRIILGFSPSAICTACGEGRRPVVEKRNVVDHLSPGTTGSKSRDGSEPTSNARGWNAPGNPVLRTEATILGYACACTPYTDHAGTGKGERGNQPWGADSTPGRPRQNQSGGLGNTERVGGWREYHLAGWTPSPTRPAIILDPFCGTGTTPLVAKTLNRTGIGVDLSHSYCKVAEWRCASGQGAKAEQRTWQAAQGSLL